MERFSEATKCALKNLTIVFLTVFVTSCGNENPQTSDHGQGARVSSDGQSLESASLVAADVDDLAAALLGHAPGDHVTDHGDSAAQGPPCSTDRQCVESEVSPTAACTCNRCINGNCDAGTPTKFGNVNCDSNHIVNLDDILCVLSGFSNENACPNSDIAPCAGNGITNLDDILAVLSAFSGSDPCSCPPLTGGCPPGDCGACCSFAAHHTDHCMVSTQSACELGGGTWMGNGTDCTADADLNDVADVCGFDCNGNGIVDTQDLQSGTASDCNANGTPDSCESSLLFGNDCNNNGIPDDCEVDMGAPDCNGNRRPDSCDLGSGTSPDCNINGVPDECDIASGVSDDCNANGVPDECDIATCPFGDPSCSDCNFDGVLDRCPICLIPGDLNNDQIVNTADQFDFDACIGNNGCWFVGCECADMDCDGDFDQTDDSMFDAVVDGQMQQVTTAIRDFNPKHGPPGTIITVQGVGFGFDPDDLCLVAMDPDDRTAIPFQVIEANDTQLIAIAGPQALDDDPAPLMIARGEGIQAQLPPQQGAETPLGGWVWRAPEIVQMQACLTDEFTPEPRMTGAIVGDFVPNGGPTKDYTLTPNVPIPDGTIETPGTVASTLFVDEEGTIVDLDVRTVIQHTAIGNIRIQLQSPAGTLVTLYDRQCGPNDNLDLRFDDESAAPLICATPTTGFLNPVFAGGTPLAAFDGEDKFGAWTLIVSDHAPGNIGILVEWSLHIVNQLQPAGGGGSLEVTLTKACPAGTKLEVYCRAWDLKSMPILGVDGYIPCLNILVNQTNMQCAQTICNEIIALYAAHVPPVTINCNVTPDGSGYKMTMSYPPPNTITWGLFSVNMPAVEIEINNTPATDDDYVNWAPTIARARVTGASGPPHVVVLTNDAGAPPIGGDVRFAAYGGVWPAGWPANTTATATTLTLALPTSAAWVPFVIAGSFANPSEDDKDAIIEVHEGLATGPICATHPLMVRVRKNGNALTTGERDRYLAAIAALHAGGNYLPFQSTHSIAGNQAHGTPAFLPWHRAFVLDYERDLQAIDPSVSAHYWKFDAPAANVFHSDFMGSNLVGGALQPVVYSATNPLFGWVPPPAGGLPAFLRRRGTVDHTGDPSTEPGFLVQLDAATLAPATFAAFTGMEGNPHGNSHVWIGGDMGAVPSAVRDPIFFMLHSNVDRLWAKWQSMGHHGNTMTEYNAQGSFVCIAAPPFRLGAHLLDTMWPWNGLTGPGFCALTTLDDRPASAPGGPLSPPAAPGFLLGPPAVPTPNNVIDYLGRTVPTTGLGVSYDDTPYN